MQPQGMRRIVIPDSCSNELLESRCSTRSRRIRPVVEGGGVVLREA